MLECLKPMENMKVEKEKVHRTSKDAKRKDAFFGHICRGSSGNDVVTILKKSGEGTRP